MNKRITLLILLLLIIFPYNVYASLTSELTYHVTRYEGQTGSENGTGTTCWWSIIPFKYKPHVALAADTDPVSTASENSTVYRNVMTPSTLAKRNNAILAVNMGLWTGTIVSDGDFLWGQSRSSNKTLYMGTDGILKAFSDSEYNTSAKVASLYPTFAINGFRVIGENGVNNYQDKASDTNRHPRTFMGQDSVTNDYFVGVCSGRKGGSDKNEAGLNNYEIYDFVYNNITTNIRILYNGDGGGSSAFVWNGQKLNYTTDGSPFMGVCDEGTPNIDASLDYYKNYCINSNNNVSCKNLTLNHGDSGDIYCAYERLLPSIVYWKEDDFYIKAVNNAIGIYDNVWIINKVEAGMTAADIKKIVYTNGTIRMQDATSTLLTDNSPIKTGNVLIVNDIYGNDRYYAFSVRGDILGEGRVSRNGASVAARQIIDKNILQGAYYNAADYNLDGQIRMNDVMKMLKEGLGN